MRNADGRSRTRPFLLPVVLVLLTLTTAWLILGFVLKFENRSGEEIIHGPFPTASGSRYAVVPVGKSYNSIPCCIGVQPDSIYDNPSGLRAWLNGRELGPAHTMHADIRSGKSAGFSHWSDGLHFYIPKSIPNDHTTILRVRYPIQYSSGCLALSGIIVVVLSFLFFCMLGSAVMVNLIVLAPYFLLRVVAYLGLGVSLIYIGCSIGAIATGWALPTTALICWSSVALWLALHQSLIGFLLLAFAAYGSLGMWLAIFNTPTMHALEEQQAALLRFFKHWGFVIVSCVLIFSLSTTWAGVIRPEDIGAMSIGGLIPFSDANGYVGGAHDEAKTGYLGYLDITPSAR